MEVMKNRNLSSFQNQPPNDSQFQCEEKLAVTVYQARGLFMAAESLNKWTHSASPEQLIENLPTAHTQLQKSPFQRHKSPV